MNIEKVGTTGTWRDILGSQLAQQQVENKDWLNFKFCLFLPTNILGKIFHFHDYSLTIFSINLSDSCANVNPFIHLKEGDEEKKQQKKTKHVFPVSIFRHIVSTVWFSPIFFISPFIFFIRGKITHFCHFSSKSSSAWKWNQTFDVRGRIQNTLESDTLSREKVWLWKQ